MKIKVSEASGTVLDWLVAKAEGRRDLWGLDAPYSVISLGYGLYCDDDEIGQVQYCPSSNWKQGGPIIEREVPLLMKTNGGDWVAQGAYNYAADRESPRYYSPTPLVAAMRCFVASRLGTEVEVPGELA